MYSSNGVSPSLGALRLSLRPDERYIGVAFGAHPLAQPAGQPGRRRQTLVPVSKAETVATSALGAPSFKYCARNGRKICWRKYAPVSLPNFSAPSELRSE